MILGLGTDLCDIRRVERSLERFGDRFKTRVFSKSERTRAESRANPAQVYAQRFAAKEACAKALGTGFRDGIRLKDIAVGNHPSGQPFIELSGKARQRLYDMAPPDTEPRIHLSLSDEYPLAQAMVVIEAVPADTPQVSRYLPPKGA